MEPEQEQLSSDVSVAENADSDDEAEIQLLERQLEAVEKEKRRLSLRQRKQELRQRLEESKKDVESLKKSEGNIFKSDRCNVNIGRTDLSGRRKSGHKSASVKQNVSDKCSLNPDKITISDLRSDEALRKSVLKQMKGFGLVSEHDSDSSSSLDSDSGRTEGSSNSDISGRSKLSKKKLKKRKKSGIEAKASDRVRFPQRWPHASLQFEFVNKAIKFDSLDLKLFVRGGARNHFG